MKTIGSIVLCLAASLSWAQGTETNMPDYLCITGVDHDNVDVWLVRTDAQMFILEEDGKIETELDCDALVCKGRGFTVKFSSSFSRSAPRTFATVVREGDPDKYLLDCTRRD